MLLLITQALNPLYASCYIQIHRMLLLITSGKPIKFERINIQIHRMLLLILNAAYETAVNEKFKYIVCCY